LLHTSNWFPKPGKIFRRFNEAPIRRYKMKTLNRGARASAGALFALVFGLVGCATPETGASSSGPTETSTESSSEWDTSTPIRIGGTLGLTGIYSGPSAAYKITFEYWADKVNSSGGIDGRQVELLIYDDESTPTVAQQLYQQLINVDDVDILLAPYTTAVGGAIFPIAERAGMLMVNPGFVSKELHLESEYMVSVWPYQESEYSLPLFSYIDTLPEADRPKTLAVLTAQNPFTLVVTSGVGEESGVRNYAAARGIEIVVDEEYDTTITDYTSLVQRAKSADADMLIVAGLPNDSAAIATTVAQLDYNPDIYCSCGSQVTTLPNWPDVGTPGQNVFATTAAFTTQDNAGFAELEEFLIPQLGITELPAYAGVALAAGQVIEQAVSATLSLDSDVLRAYIGQNPFETAVGNISYNEDGTLTFAALLLQFQTMGNELIWPLDLQTNPAIIPLRP
jgi:branched-chain amino acid transport system substrate-binding protein